VLLPDVVGLKDLAQRIGRDRSPEARHDLEYALLALLSHRVRVEAALAGSYLQRLVTGPGQGTDDSGNMEDGKQRFRGRECVSWNI
jgi:hypothetical protein